MSQHTPWSQEEAEEWANSYMAERQITPEDEGSKLLFDSFLAGLAKAAEVIAKSPTMYGSHIGDPINRYWENRRGSCDTHQAKLVGVRPIEKGNEK